MDELRMLNSMSKNFAWKIFQLGCPETSSVAMYFCSGLLQVVVQQFTMNWSHSQVNIPQLADMHML